MAGQRLLVVPRACQVRYADGTDQRLLDLFETVPNVSDTGSKSWQFKQALQVGCRVCMLCQCRQAVVLVQWSLSHERFIPPTRWHPRAPVHQHHPVMLTLAIELCVAYTANIPPPTR